MLGQTSPVEVIRGSRPETTRKVSWAASLGDRSENADYQYNKKKLREIDRRVRYLRKALERLKVVDYDPVQEGKVFFCKRHRRNTTHTTGI